MKSALARVHAMGMLYTTAIRSSAFTSTSCGWGSSGSQKKIDEVDLPFDDRRPDLLVAAEWTTQESGDGQVELLGENASRSPGREQLMPAQRAAVVARPLEQTDLLVVVGDEGDTFAHRHRDARWRRLGLVYAHFSAAMIAVTNATSPLLPMTSGVR